MVEREDAFLHRPAIILGPDSPISTVIYEGDTFVVYDGKVGVGGSRITHRKAALQTSLYYPGTEDDRPMVDDGGQIYDDGEKLIISSYFTSSTRPKALWDALMSGQEVDREELKKEIRRSTGQLVANITGRHTVVMHEDKTSDSFFPNN